MTMWDCVSRLLTTTTYQNLILTLPLESAQHEVTPHVPSFSNFKFKNISTHRSRLHFTKWPCYWYWVLDFQPLHILVAIMQNICILHNTMGSKDAKLGYKKQFPIVHKVKCMKMKLESVQTFDKFELKKFVNVLLMSYGHVFQSLRCCIIYLFSVYFQSPLWKMYIYPHW